MQTALAYREEFLLHDTGHHPENSDRLVSILNKLKKTNYYKNLIRPEIREAYDYEVAAVHDLSYVKDFKKKSENGKGYLDGDTPYCEFSNKAALLAAGSGIALADLLLEKKAKNGIALVRPPGHHAEKEKGMGFCIFNNIAVTAKYLQSKGIGKILIVDWDVHHGNGTQNCFYNDDSVFFISTHQYPFYPGTGSLQERGSGLGSGYTLNIPLQRGSGDSDYKRAFEEKILPVIDSYQPEIILISAGFDAHKDDPLGGMELSTKAYEKFTEILLKKADEYCEGRVISFLEGGYDLEALADSVEAHLSVLVG